MGSHALLQERMSMMTQTFSPESVQSVSELTFDDKDSPSHGVCKDGNRKRNRSRGHSLDWDQELEEQLLEMVTEKLNVRNVHKMKIEKKEMLQQEQQNRGLSFGTILKNPKKYTIDREQVENDFQSRRSSISSDTPSCHKFVQKTVLKSEKCLGCDKRMRFGKMELRCGVCRLSIHEECCVLAPQYCGVSHRAEVKNQLSGR